MNENPVWWTSRLDNTVSAAFEALAAVRIPDSPPQGAYEEPARIAVERMVRTARLLREA